VIEVLRLTDREKNRVIKGAVIAMSTPQRFGALGGQLGVSTPNCLAYSAFSRCQPNFIASAPTMRPIGSPERMRYLLRDAYFAEQISSQSFHAIGAEYDSSTKPFL
jgi:hypothetical protein